MPKGWEGHFELDRGNAAADDFIGALEQAWHAAGELQGSTLYQYVTETDGSVSTYQFEGAVFRLTSAGQWKGDAAATEREGNHLIARACSSAGWNDHHEFRREPAVSPGLAQATVEQPCSNVGLAEQW